MFVRPELIAEVGRRHPGIGRLRLVVGRSGEVDTMVLRAESAEKIARWKPRSQTLFAQ